MISYMVTLDNERAYMVGIKVNYMRADHLKFHSSYVPLPQANLSQSPSPSKQLVT